MSRLDCTDAHSVLDLRCGQMYKGPFGSLGISSPVLTQGKGKR